MNLYLLQFKDGERFKIGIATSVPQRIQQLGGSKHFDLDKSIVVSGNATAVKRLERQLHGDFAPYNVPCDELLSGNTEIFDMECWGGVIGEVQSKIDRFPHLKFNKKEGVELPKRDKKAINTGLKVEVKTKDIREFIDFLTDNAETITISHGPKTEIDIKAVFSNAPDLISSPLPRITIKGNRTRYDDGVLFNLIGKQTEGGGKIANYYGTGRGFSSTFSPSHRDRFFKFISDSLDARCPEKVTHINTLGENVDKPESLETHWQDRVQATPSEKRVLG